MNDKNKTPDLAYATVRGVPNVLVMRNEYYGDWLTGRMVQGHVWHSLKQVTDVVPARAVRETHVVVDPESLSDVEERAACLKVCEQVPVSTRLVRGALRAFAAKQSRPPLAEPGQYGVVLAGSRLEGEGRREWCHWDDNDWRDPYGDSGTWSDLIDPVLVRPGVDDEAES